MPRPDIRRARGRKRLLRQGSGYLAALLVAALIGLGPVFGQNAASSLAPVIDAVLHKGPDNQLPAHLSVVLGITHTEQPVAVKQAVIRDTAIVRTFNVCKDNHADVVLAVYNEQTRAFKGYLIDPKGTLRKAVAYQAGEAPTVRSVSEAHADFVQELNFWTKFQHGARAAPAPAPAAK